MSFTSRDSAERWRGGDEDGRRATVGRWRGGGGNKRGNETWGDGDGVREDGHTAAGAAVGVAAGGSAGRGVSDVGSPGGRSGRGGRGLVGPGRARRRVFSSKNGDTGKRSLPRRDAWRDSPAP
ncbi:glycine-rich RNA-binding protein 10-like [Miscanthus floridulus]|uniref:glycine-rich RNA-binding protein 10-like n=1 Tax=Miscanthus floridulus TaxID=154761 RepID=UPI003459088E